MLCVGHVDEIDQDHAAEVAHPQLARNRMRRFEVGPEDGVVEIAPADITTGIDVDGIHRLGLIDDQIAARFQIDPSCQRAFEFLFGAMQIEERTLSAITPQFAQQRRHVGRGKGLHLIEGCSRVDDDRGGLIAGEVAQYPFAQTEFLIEQRRGVFRLARFEDLPPACAQIADIGGERTIFGFFGHGPHDESAFLFWWHQGSDALTQLGAFAVAGDPLRYADMRILRQVDKHSSGDAHLARQACAFGADRVLDHLDQQRLAFVERLFDGCRLAAAARLPEICHMQKGRPIEADIDECRLHAWQHP